MSSLSSEYNLEICKLQWWVLVGALKNEPIQKNNRKLIQKIENFLDDYFEEPNRSNFRSFH